MKKLFFSACFLLSGIVMFAQTHRNRPPATVQQSFQRDNPNANNPIWHQQNGQWNATYKDADKGRTVNAYYDRAGKNVETRRDWDRKDVPADVDKRVNEKYHANGKYNVTRIERPNQDPLFQIKLNLGGIAKIVYTDEKGNEVKYRR